MRMLGLQVYRLVQENPSCYGLQVYTTCYEKQELERPAGRESLRPFPHPSPPPPSHSLWGQCPGPQTVAKKIQNNRPARLRPPRSFPRQFDVADCCLKVINSRHFGSAVPYWPHRAIHPNHKTGPSTRERAMRLDASPPGLLAL